MKLLDQLLDRATSAIPAHLHGGVVVFGSAPMVFDGLKPDVTFDLDLFVSDQTYAALLGAGFTEDLDERGLPRVMVAEAVEVVRVWTGVSFEQLFRASQTREGSRGLRVAALEHVLAFKALSGREKDQREAEVIRKALRRHAVRIRDLTAADLPSIHALNEAGAPGVHPEPPEQLAAITRESCIALAAEIDGVVVGFCQVLPPGADYRSVNYAWFSARYDDFVYLDRVAVAEELRGGGIGALLYAEVERRTKAPWFTLEVNLRPRNEGSLRFHARHGFLEVGQQETDYGALVSLMAKRLR